MEPEIHMGCRVLDHVVLECGGEATSSSSDEVTLPALLCLLLCGFREKGEKRSAKEEASLIGRDCRAGRGFQGAIFARTDAGDLLLELLGAAVLGRLLPPVVRAARHVVRDHVLGLANHACLFLGQCRREVELRSGLTCGCREGVGEVGGQRSGARGRPESAGECAQSRGGKLSARRAALGGRARPRFGPGVAGGGLAARGMRSRWVRTGCAPLPFPIFTARRSAEEARVVRG